MRIFGIILVSLGVLVAVLLADKPDPVIQHTPLAVAIGPVSEVMAQADNTEFISGNDVAIASVPSVYSVHESENHVADYQQPAVSSVNTSARVVKAESSEDSGMWERMLGAVVDYVGKDRVININIDGSSRAAANNQSYSGSDQYASLEQDPGYESYDDGGVRSNCPEHLYQGGNAYARNMLIKMGCPLPP